MFGLPRMLKRWRSVGARPSYRPTLEALESRITPFTYSWIGPAQQGGAIWWDIATNWRNAGAGAPPAGSYPGYNPTLGSTTDDIAIVRWAPGISIQYRDLRGGAGGSATLQSLQVNAGPALTDGELDMTAPLTITGGGNWSGGVLMQNASQANLT